MENSDSDVKALFMRALDIEDFSERERFLASACGSETELLKRVRKLLAASEPSDDDFLDPNHFGSLAKERLSFAAELTEEHRFFEGLGARIVDLGDYELIEEIGRGAVGVVFRARQKSLNREVAVKIVFGAALASREERERFRVEAEAAAHLSHPNIVPIIEIGHEKGCDFYSMALVEGGTLADLVQSRRLAHREAVSLMITVAQAVRNAHDRGVIHRDIKPQNILIDQDGEPHVSDFGLACRIEQESTLTLTGQIMGTPRYMAPEQAEPGDRQITTAVDIYSMGAVLYELLSGSPPHVSDSVLSTLDQIRSAQPVSLRRVLPQIDRDLATVVHKSLEKSPEARYDSAKAMAEDLEAWLDGRHIAARPPTPLERSGRWLRRYPFQAAFALTAVVLLLTLGVGAPFVAWQQSILRKESDEAREAAEAAEQQSLLAMQEAQLQARVNRRQAYAANMRLIQLSSQLRQDSDASPKSMITSWKPVAGEIDERGWEWYYSYGQVERETESYRVPPNVQSLAYSPSEDRILISGERGTVALDVTNGAELRTKRGEGHRFSQWSPSGDRIVTAGFSGEVKLWDAASLNALSPAIEGIVARSVACGPTDDQLAILDDRDRIFILELGELGTAPKVIEESSPIEGLSQIAWSGDGDFIAAIGDSPDVYVWPVGGLGQSPDRLTGSGSGLTKLAWLQSAPWLATGSVDGSVEVWKVPQRDSLMRIQNVDKGAVSAIGWNEDGVSLLFAQELGEGAYRLDLSSGESDLLRAFAEPIAALDWKADHYSITVADSNGQASSWREGLPESSRVLWKQESPLTDVRWKSNGVHIHCLDSKGKLDLVNTLSEESFAPLRFVERPQLGVLCPGASEVVFLSRGPGSTKKVTVTAPEQQHHESVFSIEGKWPQALGWAGRNTVLVAGEGGRVETIERDSGIRASLKQATDDKELTYFTVSSSPDEKYIAASGSGGWVTIWEAASGNIVIHDRVVSNFMMVRNHAWHPDGTRLATGNADGRVTVWSLADLGRDLEFMAHEGHISALAWHPDGRRLASAGRKGMIRIWDAESGEMMLMLEGHEREARQLAWSVDGWKLISAGADGVARIWDATAGHMLDLATEPIDLVAR